MIKGEDWFKLDDPENYPEFWELVVEKDYEILRFILPGNNIIHVQNAKNNIEFMLKNSNTYKIYQVKRLSDGEIFTVGDKIRYNNTNNIRIIREIELHNNTLKIFACEECYSTPIKGFNYGFNLLENVTKFKQPLFTTEDDVDIFEGDSFYNINNKDWLLRNIIKINLLDYQTYYKNQINFSTKEKAEEYIIMNKPILSINDLLNYQSATKQIFVPIKTLKDLVKQKLNNNN
jgi:hypothetical protein